MVTKWIVMVILITPISHERHTLQTLEFDTFENCRRSLQVMSISKLPGVRYIGCVPKG